jgi:hypothetical protein
MNTHQYNISISSDEDNSLKSILTCENYKNDTIGEKLDRYLKDKYMFNIAYEDLVAELNQDLYCIHQFLKGCDTHLFFNLSTNPCLISNVHPDGYQQFSIRYDR